METAAAYQEGPRYRVFSHSGQLESRDPQVGGGGREGGREGGEGEEEGGKRGRRKGKGREEGGNPSTLSCILHTVYRAKLQYKHFSL